MKVSRYHSGLARILQFVLSPLGYFDWSMILTKELDDDIRLYPSRIPLVVRDAEKGDLVELSKATPYHLIGLLEERFAVGRCLIAQKDGQVAGFNWYVTGPVYDESFRIELDPGDIYCMDAMTYQGYRGQAVHIELLSRLLMDAKDRGMRKAFTRASILNESSWKAHARLGWRHHGSTFLIKLRPQFGSAVLAWPRVYPLRNDALFVRAAVRKRL